MSRSLRVFILGLFTSLLLVGCNESKIPRHQRVINDDQVERSDSEAIERREVVQFSAEHLQLQALVQSENPADWISATGRLNEKLFGAQAVDKQFYGSRDYAGYLAVYQDLFQVFRASTDAAFNDQFVDSLQKFRNLYLKDCINSYGNSCKFVRDSLRKTSSLINIIIYFAEKESDDQAKLALIGTAYEVGNRRSKEALSRLYIETYFRLVDKGERIVERVRHADNVESSLRFRDWSAPDDFNLVYFLKFEPWKVAEKNEDIVSVRMKKTLFPYISVYIARSKNISTAFSDYVQVHWQKKLKKTNNLAEYPAYSDINIDELVSSSPLEGHLILSVYFNEISIPEANGFVRNVPNRSEFMQRLFANTRLLVRWDMAHLSIETTKSLAEQFNSQNIKSPDHVASSKEFAKTVLTPKWIHFHTRRTEVLQNLLEAQDIYFTNEENFAIKEFFSSIDRNVMKTVIYPNMMAFMFYMIKSELKEKLFGIFSFSADEYVELFFAGAYRGLWFDFLKSEDGLGRGELNIKKSLFRFELVDAFYYFFATKTNEAYQVDTDDFISSLLKDVLIEREMLLGTVQEAQLDLYDSSESKSRRWARWCRQIKAEGFSTEPELIEFYDLDKYLIGHSKYLFDQNLEIGNKMYYGDEFYTTELDSILGTPDYYVSTNSVTDRIRHEIFPILDYFDQVMAAVKRLKPDGKETNLVESEKYRNTILSRVQSYLGQQIYYGKQFDDCLYTSVKESRRRARSVLEAEKKYFTEIIYPILGNIQENQMTLGEANLLLKEINGQSPLYTSKIVSSDNGKILYYNFTKQSFLNRVRNYLTKGLVVSHPILGVVEIKPIVGDHLNVAIPPDFNDDEDNPFRFIRAREAHYSLDVTADQFAVEALQAISDEFPATKEKLVFTQWEAKETFLFTTNTNNWESHEKSRMEFLVQRYLYSGVKVADFAKRECRRLGIILPEDCLIENNLDMFELAKAMNQSYSVIELDQNKIDHLNLLGEQNFLHSQNLGIQLRFDASRGGMMFKQSVLTFKGVDIPYNSAKGLFDLPLEMIKSPFLGRSFVNEYYVSINQRDSGMSTGKGRSATSPDSERDLNYWKDSYWRSKEFYQARAKRGIFLFKFDKKIIEEQFEDVKEDLMVHLKGAEEFHASADKWFQQLRGEAPASYRVTLDRQPLELVPLRSSSLQYIDDTALHHTKTGDIYKSEIFETTELLESY